MVVNEKYSQFNAKKVQRFLSKFSRKFPPKSFGVINVIVHIVNP